MPKPVLYFIYTAMVSIGLVAMYTILNAGNPDSFMRPYVGDPALDVYVAMGSSFIVFVLGFFVFYSRDREGFRNLVDLNREKIRELRSGGVSDDTIADEILAAMGSIKGYRHNLARRKLIIALSEFQ
ncbi:MAG: hypothetical protein HKM93_05510 [Desulfobacteraceae bacterium]|nr:hypothetical protein [Desulfobacteraceae bacterium]